MKKIDCLIFLIVLSFSFILSQSDIRIPETLLPMALLDKIIQEASGDLTLQNELSLAGRERNRPAEEYINRFYETQFVYETLKEYGIEETEIISIPSFSETIWDAEMAELWLTSPERRKIADLKEIAASLCPGSATADIEAELVYAGPGNKDDCYIGKDITGKIVLVSGYPEAARKYAVEKYGAAGIVSFGCGLTPDSLDCSEDAVDDVTWRLDPLGDGQKSTFAFMISPRQGRMLRDMLERGLDLRVRATCKTQRVPIKEEMVSALLKGNELPGEELVFIAHLFEGYHKQAANDNASGCVSLMETARVIKTLVDNGAIPPLKRSVRFLFVPEIEGTVAYLEKYPEIAKRFFACINEDIVGTALAKSKAYFILERAPHSCPSYLNDVLEAFFEWMGVTQRPNDTYGYKAAKPIHSPTGGRDPFYYRVGPYLGGSDHTVFLDGGVRVPSVMLMVWPDQWSHTSGDRVDKTDSTQLKRVIFISVATAVFLANADADAALKIIAEVSARALKRIGNEELNVEHAIISSSRQDIHAAYKEMDNVISQMFLREKAALRSIEFFIKDGQALPALLRIKLDGLDNLEKSVRAEVEATYELECRGKNIKPKKPSLSQEEVRLSKLVPVRTEKMKGFFVPLEYRKDLGSVPDIPEYELGEAEFEVRNFIDGKRSILDIRNAASAEYRPLALKDVEGCIRFLKKLGFVTILNQ